MSGQEKLKRKLFRGCLKLDDTIAAIATALGESGIGIVRISGEKALKVADQLFVSPKGKKISDLQTYRAAYGYFIEPITGARIDEVIVTVMKAPRSYTREDVVEFSCHGGIVAVKSILEIVLKQGVRLAEPGEFTKRAFLNGRIDLSQAEAVIDLIRAKTETGMRVALNQLTGSLAHKINSIKFELLELIAHLEALIDFPEDDLEELAVSEVKKKSEETLAELEQLIASSKQGKIYRDGISAAIIGRPNVGKSSLLNALLQENRAIVTEIPGTTRDIIEDIVNIRGIPLKLVDTAGIRETENLIEQIGVTKTKEFIGRSDLVFFVLDAGTGIIAEDKEIISLLKDKKMIVLVNKSDLDEDYVDYQYLTEELPHCKVVKISVLTGFGLDQLEEELVRLVDVGIEKREEQVLVSNIRHQQALLKARDSLLAVIASCKSNLPLDFLTIDLKNAWEYLGEITGESLDDQLISTIFSQFCIGK